MNDVVCEIEFVGGAKDGHKMQMPGRLEDQPKVIRYGIDAQERIVVPSELIDRSDPVGSAVRTSHFIKTLPRAPETSTHVYELRRADDTYRYYFVKAISPEEMNDLAKRIFFGEASKEDPRA
jgi:hypothetical protein